MALLALIAARAEATTIVYPDRDAFNAAAGNTTLLTFDEAPPCFRPDGGLFICRFDYGVIEVQYEPSSPPAPPYIRYSQIERPVFTQLQEPLTAIGFDVIPLDTAARFSLFGFAVSTTTPAFVGFVNDDGTPFTSFEINHFNCPEQFRAACSFTIDNMAVQPVQPVPESDTFWLEAFCAALFLLSAAHRPRSVNRYSHLQ